MTAWYKIWNCGEAEKTYYEFAYTTTERIADSLGSYKIAEASQTEQCPSQTEVIVFISKNSL